MKKTIALVTPYYVPHGGGLERYAHEMAMRLLQSGHHVVVVTSGDKDSTEKIDGITVYRLKSQLTISNTPFSFSWIFTLRTIFKKELVDIVNIHVPVPGIGDLAALVSGRRKVVVTYHAGPMKKGRFLPDSAVAFYETLLLPRLLQRADAIIATSAFVRSFLKRYQAKITVVTPGVDTDFFVPGAKKANTVLFVGGLNAAEEYKGLSLALHAVSEARKKIPAIEIVVVGDGDKKAAYEAEAQQLGVPAYFTGRLEGSMLREQYQKASVLLAPTSNDNFPLTILEALSCGTPVLSTRVGSIPDIITDGVEGYLVDTANPSEVTAQLVALLGTNAFNVQARARALDHTWQNQAALYEAALCREWRTHVQISAYYPPHTGGVEMVASRTAQLQSMHSKVVVLTSGGMHPQTTFEGKVQVRRLWSLEFAHTPFAPTLLWHLLRLPRASIVHVHITQAWWPECVWLLIPMRRIPYIAHFHLDVEPSGFFGPLFVLYKKLFWGPVLRGASAVLACSPAQVSLLLRYGVSPSRISVVPNGVGEEFFVARTFAPPVEVLKLLYVGRLAPQKQVQHLLGLMSSLKIPAHLTIVGNGEEYDSLTLLAAEKKLTNVTFAGEKRGEELQSMYQTHDLFVIASQKEGLPLAVLEAMAAGLPVVGSNVIGLRELLLGVGELVGEPFQDDASRVITELWHSPERLEGLSMRSREKAKEFSWGAFHAALTQAYTAI